MGEFAFAGVDASNFEDVDVVEIVFALSIGEGGEDAVAEVGHFRAMGLADSDSGWLLVINPSPTPPQTWGEKIGVEGMEVAEGVGDDLVESGAQGGFADLIGEEFKSLGSTDGCGSDGEGFRDFFVSVDTADFFDEVFFAENVDSPGGGLDFYGIGADAENSEAEIFEVGLSLFDGDVHAEEGAGSANEDGEFVGLGGGGVDVNDSAYGLFAGDFGVEFGESVQGGNDAFGVNGSLESVARFGEKSEFLPGSADGGVDEVGRFEEASGGGFTDFSRLAAHDSGEGDGVVGIGDDHVVGLEFVGCAVEGRELFSGFCLADDDSLTSEGIEIEGVERLPDFEHDIVGEVNEERDRSLTDLAKSSLEPFGAGAVVEILENPSGITSAGSGLDFDRSFRPDIAIVSVGSGESVGRSGVKLGGSAEGVFGEELAREAQHGGTIASVGHDIDI